MAINKQKRAEWLKEYRKTPKYKNYMKNYMRKKRLLERSAFDNKRFIKPVDTKADIVTQSSQIEWNKKVKRLKPESKEYLTKLEAWVTLTRDNNMDYEEKKTKLAELGPQVRVLHNKVSYGTDALTVAKMIPEDYFKYSTMTGKFQSYALYNQNCVI